MKTENIKAVFSEYLIAKTNYALLIDGSWGSGKTFFWKNELDKIVENNGLKSIYLSLNGIGSISDLQYHLLVRLMPIISRNEKSVKILKGMMDIVARKMIGKGLDDIIQGVSIENFDFSEYVVCIDDLERCQIPIKEVLGYINNLVEHKAVKTIILADENNIERENKSRGYDNIKEKVIGRILKFEIEIPEILPHLSNKYEGDFLIFLRKHQKFISGLFVEYKVQNLRLINFYLSNLNRIFTLIKDVDTVYVEEVLLFTATISIEFKKGSLKSSDYNDYKQLDIASLFYARRVLREQAKNEEGYAKAYADEFYDQYLLNRSESFHFYESIYKYILTGYLNEPDLISEIKKRYPVDEDDKSVVFRDVFTHKFRALANEEFSNSLIKALRYTQEGAYNIYDYAQIADFLYFFSNNSIINLSNDDIYKIINNGLKASKNTTEYNDRALENLLHFSNENNNVTIVKELIRQIHNDLKGEFLEEEINDFVNAVKSNNSTLLSAKFEKYTLSKDLFQHLNVNDLFTSILESSNAQLDTLNNALNKRYSSINIGEFLFEDSKALNELQTLLKQHLINDQIGQPRLFLISQLKDNLLHIIDKLYNSRKI